MNTKFDKNNAPVKLYRNPISGHCHRVELILAFLGIPYSTIDLDMPAGEHKSADYLKISPLGQVPAIDDNGFHLADSNAILVYLIEKYSQGHEWLPRDPISAAEVQRWFSIAAGEIASGPCAARLVKVFGADLDYEKAKQTAISLFNVMEPICNTRAFLTGDKITAADVAGYSYISHAPEGGVSLAPYPAIRGWLKRIEEYPGFVGMPRSPGCYIND